MKLIKKLIISLFYIILFAIIIIFYFLILDKHNLQLKCPIYSIFNLYCPGCGLTRMISSILRLNFYQAFRYNPLIFISLPIIILLSLDKYINWLKDKKTCLYNKINNKTWYAILIITIIYFIIRNIETFDYLIPTSI